MYLNLMFGYHGDGMEMSRSQQNYKSDEWRGESTSSKDACILTFFKTIILLLNKCLYFILFTG